jgi:putative ABC transport system permease protein
VRSRGIDPVWRHAPLVLLRYRTLFAAIAFGSLLLALAAAAYPLFLSATTSSLVRTSIERESVTRFGGGITYRFVNMPLEPRRLNTGGRSADPADIGPAFDRLAGASPILGPTITTILGDGVSLSVPGSDETREVRPFSATGVLDHVELLRGHDGPGVWLPDLVADALGASPGSTVVLTAQNGRSVEVAVDGIYRAVYTIYDAPSDGFWLAWYDNFAIPCGDCSPPAQPILGDPRQILALEDDLHADTATMQWNAPIADPSAVSLEDVEALASFERDVRARVAGDGPTGRLFDCCHDFFFFNRTATTLSTSIGFVITDVHERVAAVEGPTRVLEIAGIAVALAVVAAAGAFSLRARRVEAAWAFARGSSAATVGLKTAFESLVPVLGGAVAGAGLAAIAVAVFGPGAPVARDASIDAVLATVAALVGAVALVSLVAAVTYLRVVDPHGRRGRRVAALVPWEAGVAILALLAYRRLQHGGAFVTDADSGVVVPSLALVAFPFLLFSAFAMVAARLARVAFGRLRRASERAGDAAYLALRRLAGGTSFTMLLVGAASLCLATFFHATVVARSLQTTVDAKAGVFVGSDVQGRIDYGTPVPDRFDLPTTRVVRLGSGARLPTDRALDVLSIDASTFARAAFWDDAFSDRSLQALVGSLTTVHDGRLPVVLAGAGDLPVDRIEMATAEIPVEVVGRATAFPGMTSLNPLLVVDGDTLARVIDLPFDPLHNPTATTELWVRGPTSEATRSLSRLEFPPTSTLTTAEVEDIPYIAAAIDTFLVVNVLGLIAAALVFVGMLMYLQARQRSQVVSYALSARMGMTHGQHRRALLFELGAMLLWGFATGLALALVAAHITVPLLDPITAVPPDPILVTPLAMIVVALVVGSAFAWLGAALTNRRARETDLAEVMRVAE